TAKTTPIYNPIIPPVAIDLNTPVGISELTVINSSFVSLNNPSWKKSVNGKAFHKNGFSIDLLNVISIENISGDNGTGFPCVGNLNNLGKTYLIVILYIGLSNDNNISFNNPFELSRLNVLI